MVNHIHRQSFNTRSAAACFAADAAVVLLFVTLSQFVQKESLTLSGVAGAGWPFAIGVMGGYVAVVFARWPAISLGAGLLVSIKMMVMAVLLAAAANQNLSPAVVLVSTVLLIGGATGWRALALRRLNGAWPRDTRTAIGRRSRLDFLRPPRRPSLFK